MATISSMVEAATSTISSATTSTMSSATTTAGGMGMGVGGGGGDSAAANATLEDPVSEGEKLAVSILLVMLSIFGTFGNGLVLYVFTRKSDKVTSTIFILSLAWCDFFTCLIIMPYTVANVQLEDHLVYDVVCKLYQFLITSNVPLSAFIMVAVAVDRYFSICHPFLHAVTPRRARMSILCLCLFAFSLGTITACMFGVYHTEEMIFTNCPNSTSGLALDRNVTGNDVIASPPTERTVDTTSNRGAGNYSKMVYDVEVVINYDSFRKNSNGSNSNSMVASMTSPSPLCTTTREKKVVYNKDGECGINDFIFSEQFFGLYQQIYISFYIISLVSVFVLYFFIYRSVVKRRAWRRKQKSWTHSPMTAVVANNPAQTTPKTSHIPRDQTNAEGENMELNLKVTAKADVDGIESDSNVDENGVSHHNNDSGISGCKSSTSSTAVGPTNVSAPSSIHLSPPATGSHTNSQLKEANSSGYGNGTNASNAHDVPAGIRPLSSSAEKKTNRERRDFNFLANIRTAVMLFVVTVVFIISFLPAWLMATWLIDYQIVVFYMYFLYNVANPIIYAFMNQSFRKELTRVFQRGTHFFRSS